MAAAASIDEYLAGFEGERRDRLASVRAAIHDVLPDAEEAIRYGMPAIALGGRHWIHFAGWKLHLGIYPVYRSEASIEAELEPYRDAKDTLQFPWAHELPLDLIRRVVVHLAH